MGLDSLQSCGQVDRSLRLDAVAHHRHQSSCFSRQVCEFNQLNSAAFVHPHAFRFDLWPTPNAKAIDTLLYPSAALQGQMRSECWRQYRGDKSYQDAYPSRAHWHKKWSQHSFSAANMETASDSVFRKPWKEISSVLLRKEKTALYLATFFSAEWTSLRFNNIIA